MLLVGRQEGHLACKKLVVRHWHGCLSMERGVNDLHMVQVIPLPPHCLLLHENPEWFCLSGAGFPGYPGKKAVKRM